MSEIWVEIVWRCSDCGVAGIVTITDAWQGLSQSNEQHIKMSPNCDVKTARIFPVDASKETNKAAA